MSDERDRAREKIRDILAQDLEGLSRRVINGRDYDTYCLRPSQREVWIDQILSIVAVLADDQEFPDPDPDAYGGEPSAISATKEAAYRAGFRRVT